MPNTQQSSSSTQFTFDPTALNYYNQMLQQFGPQLLQMGTQPLQNPFFYGDVNAAGRAAAQGGMNQMQNLFGNARQTMFGGSSPSPFMQSQIAQTGRGQSAQFAQGLQGALGNAQQRQMFSLGTGMGFQPLMTGSNTQSGSGPTWGGLALNAALGAATGGLSMAGGGMGGGVPMPTGQSPAGTMGGGGLLNPFMI